MKSWIIGWGMARSAGRKPQSPQPIPNSTGPFRWFIYESLIDRKPLDRMVTELILMRGDPVRGGSAGFGQAAENDAPFAAKAHIIASSFWA